MTIKDNQSKEFNEVAFDGSECEEGKVLVTMVLDEGTEEWLTKRFHVEISYTMNKMSNGKKVPTTRVQCDPEEYEGGKRIYNQEVSDYFDHSNMNKTIQVNGEKITIQVDSLDACLEAASDMDKRGYDPTGSDKEVRAQEAKSTIESLAKDVADKYPEAEELLRLLMLECTQAEIGAILYPHLKKSQISDRIRAFKAYCRQVGKEKYYD